MESAVMTCKFQQNIFKQSNKRRINWAGHVERMGERRGACSVCWGNMGHLKGLGIVGIIILTL
jgi:hypothetical protein